MKKLKMKVSFVIVEDVKRQEEYFQVTDLSDFEIIEVED